MIQLSKTYWALLFLNPKIFSVRPPNFISQLSRPSMIMSNNSWWKFYWKPWESEYKIHFSVQRFLNPQYYTDAWSTFFNDLSNIYFSNACHCNNDIRRNWCSTSDALHQLQNKYITRFSSYISEYFGWNIPFTDPMDNIREISTPKKKDQSAKTHKYRLKSDYFDV